MDFNNQVGAIAEIKKCAERDVHSILISGTKGVGKSYLAKMFSRIKGIPDVVYVRPSVQDVKDAVDACIGSQSPIVLCIENLDTGVNAASYAMLKFLEEPSQNVYIIITCRNIKQIPDTILSRTIHIAIPAMTEDDLLRYAQSKDIAKADDLHNNKSIWKCIKSASDVDTLVKLSKEQIDYIMQAESLLSSNDPVSSIMWKVQKFPDNSTTPAELMIRYVMLTYPDKRVFKMCYDCLNDISSGRIAVHAAIAKLVFQFKYMMKGNKP